jgi:hypothetical protein
MRWLPALCLFWISATAVAEQAVRSGDYVIHYSAIRTTALTPEVARQFDVRRSRNQALLVLNAQVDRGGPLPEPIPATATGVVTSLLGHRQTLKLRPHQEGTVHYVIARFETIEREHLTLDLEVLPEGATTPIPVRWQQQFFND